MHLVTSDAALSGFSECAFGICIVSENAFGIGVTAIPSPIADIEWDGWFVYRTFALVSADAVAAASVSHSGSSPLLWSARFDIDSKAMRKFKESDVMVGVIEFQSEIGTATVDATLNTRILSKLP